MSCRADTFGQFSPINGTFHCLLAFGAWASVALLAQAISLWKCRRRRQNASLAQQAQYKEESPLPGQSAAACGIELQLMDQDLLCSIVGALDVRCVMQANAASTQVESAVRHTRAVQLQLVGGTVRRDQTLTMSAWCHIGAPAVWGQLSEEEKAVRVERLCTACRDGDAVGARAVFNNGIDLNRPGDLARRSWVGDALGWSVEGSQFDLLHFRLVRQANPSQVAARSACPLHFAAQKGDLRSTQLLVQFGAQVLLKSRDGRDAIGWTSGVDPTYDGPEQDRKVVREWLVNQVENGCL